MATPFKTIHTGDSQLDRIQQNISDAFNIAGGALSGGALIQNISLATGVPKAINHGLNRQPTLWVLADINAGALVYRTAWSTNSITLESSANCNISIWVN